MSCGYVRKLDCRVDNLATRVACLEERERKNEELNFLRDKKNEEIDFLRDKLFKMEAERYTDSKTAGMVRGETFLRPSKLADNYHGSYRVLSTHKPIVEVEGEVSTTEPTTPA